MSAASAPREAVEQAAAAALADGLRADAALLFAGPGFSDALPELIDAAVGALGTENLVGATAHGVLGCGQEVEGGAAVTAVVIEGCETLPFLLGDLAGHEATAGAEIAAQLGGSARPEDLVVLLPDAAAFDTGAVVEGVRDRLETTAVVGAGAADARRGAPVLWCGRRRESGGLAGLVIRGSRPARIGVTQACRPVTGPLRVTRIQGHWIMAIDGRPALDVYREAALGALADDLRRAAAFVLVAIPQDDAPLDGSGGYVVRQVVGFSEAERAFAIPETLEPGDTIAFAVREPEAAREDLLQMLAGLEAEPAALALYFNCCARGSQFFGVPGVEAAYLDRALGPAPVAGMFGSCEIGPIGAATELLTYTGVLALLDA